MGRVRQASAIALVDDERAYLERLARRRKVARGDADSGEGGQ